MFVEVFNPQTRQEMRQHRLCELNVTSDETTLTYRQTCRLGVGSFAAGEALPAAALHISGLHRSLNSVWARGYKFDIDTANYA